MLRSREPLIQVDRSLQDGLAPGCLTCSGDLFVAATFYGWRGHRVVRCCDVLGFSRRRRGWIRQLEMFIVDVTRGRRLADGRHMLVTVLMRMAALHGVVVVAVLATVVCIRIATVLVAVRMLVRRRRSGQFCGLQVVKCVHHRGCSEGTARD